ncbi:hypothetical protein JTE90_003126 [Oedothorax gibbosus]|uniref:Glutamate receptor ionotropic, kainate 2 n=1 Tax=Oedothorax gibbosus TaxID=931172 RepID=A0AAV6VDL5_9ARAC|nr:hypothetical protein JTE90_003126 [Oedothorax gibbosus]
MELFKWILTWVSIVGIVHSLPGRIHVGGLFESDDDEVELAFRIAVEWANTHGLLNSSRMVAMVERLYSQEAIKTTQLCCGLLDKGLAAIFGPQQVLPSQHVQSICDDLEVPHIESRFEFRLDRDQLSINLYPRPEVLSNAIVKLLDIWGWNNFYVVYEHDDAIVRLKSLFEEGEKRDWKIKLYQFRDEDSFRDTFWEIKRSLKSLKKDPSKKDEEKVLDYRIVLDVSKKNLYHALKSAQQVGMMTENQKYLITSLDLHTIDLEDFQYSKTNISSLRLVQEESAEFQALLQDLNSRLTRRIEQQPLKSLKTEAVLIYDSVKLLAYGLQQMDLAKNISVFPSISCQLMNKGIDGTSLVNFMKNVKNGTGPTGYLGLSGLLEFDEEGFRSKVVLDVMFLSSTGLKKIGSILPGPGKNTVHITPQESSEYQYVGLEGSHFRVTTILTDPYAMFSESSQLLTGNKRFEGYCIDLLEALAELLTFTFEIHVVKDGKSGSFDKDTKTWNGMIGEVVNNEADLAVADVTITTQRMKGVDFTLPFMQTGISILFKKPTTKVTSLFSFLFPFSGEVWLLVMAAYTFISISYFLVGRISPYEWSNPHPCRQNDQVEENVFSLLNSMWFAIGSLMQQGSDIAPTAMSTRAITSIWYFFCLILISSYTANLAAFLTVEKLVSPIESAEDLVKQDKIKYGATKSGSTYAFFKSSNMTTYKKMGQVMQANEEYLVQNNAEGIKRVKEGNYAFLMEATSIEYNTERECNLTQVGGLLDNKGYGIAVRKGNETIRSWLSGGILRLQEQGKLHTFKERWWKQKKGGGQCSGPSKSSGTVNELGLGNVGGVFVVMLLGIMLSALMGVIEFLWFQRKVQRDSEMSIFKLLMREIKYAVTCGSSSKPAPKLKTQKADVEAEKPLPGYSSLY